MPESTLARSHSIANFVHAHFQIQVIYVSTYGPIQRKNPSSVMCAKRLSTQNQDWLVTAEVTREKNLLNAINVPLFFLSDIQSSILH